MIAWKVVTHNLSSMVSHRYVYQPGTCLLSATPMYFHRTLAEAREGCWWRRVGPPRRIIEAELIDPEPYWDRQTGETYVLAHRCTVLRVALAEVWDASTRTSTFV